MKYFLILLPFIFSLNLYSQTTACLEKGRKYFASKEYAIAEKTLEKCVVSHPNNIDILISVAGVKMVLAKYDDAQKYFTSVLKILPKDSPYYAYIYSCLGDIAMHKADIKQATISYENALKYEPANINSLVGLGVCKEKRGQIQGAAELYRRALAVDFTNLIARERLISLEPDILTEEEILLTLKERNIIAPEAEEYGEEDFVVLNKMLKAERARGIEYLSIKFAGAPPEGSVVERDKGKFYARKMLTITGYQYLIEKLSSDAKEFLLSQGITPIDLFQLRDFDDKKIFDDKGNLTDEGLIAYSKMLKGQKSYLLPKEKNPYKRDEADALAQKYLRSGYSEISFYEYSYVEEQTQCSEKTLVSSLKVRIIKTMMDKRRYFVLSKPDTVPPYSIPYILAQEYRELFGKHNQEEPPEYTKTFGEDNRQTLKLCNKDGNLMSFKDIKK